MIKSLVPEVSKLVGVSSALLLNQLTLLLKTWGKSKIYRTNKQLFEDMEGILSESTIKRSKAKLVDAGLIEVTFDRGIKRQSFFSLTDKAKNLLDGFINPKKKESFVKTTGKKETNMEKSFKEGFNNPNAVKNPKKKDVAVEQKTVEESNKTTATVDLKFGNEIPEHNPNLNFNTPRKSLKETLKTEQQKNVKKETSLNESTLSFKEKLLSKVLPIVGKKDQTDYSMEVFNSKFEEEDELAEMRGFYGV